MKAVVLILLFIATAKAEIYRVEITESDGQLYEYLSNDNGIKDKSFTVEFDGEVIWFYTSKEDFWFKWEVLPEEIQNKLLIKGEQSKEIKT